jgi:hypothetical protein
MLCCLIAATNTAGAFVAADGYYERCGTHVYTQSRKAYAALAQLIVSFLLALGPVEQNTLVSVGRV